MCFKQVFYNILLILTLSLFTVYVVLPFQVIVQNYNSVLTLSRLYQLSDAILVHENDTVHKICSRLMNIKHISISDVNKVIAHQLASVLQPAYTADSPCHYSTNPIGTNDSQFTSNFRQLSVKMALLYQCLSAVCRGITDFFGVSP